MTFKLKNAHKHRALDHAISLATRKLAQTELADRMAIVDHIRATVLKIFTPSTDDVGANVFIAEGLAEKTNDLCIGDFDKILFGTPTLSERFFPMIIEKIEAKQPLQRILTLGNLGSLKPHQLRLSRPIVSYHVRNDPFDAAILNLPPDRRAPVLLPRATLFAALYLTTTNPAIVDAQTQLRQLLTRAIEIAERLILIHRDLIPITRAISQCVTDDDLITIFPAAHQLFATRQTAVELPDSKEGAAVLRAL